MATKVVIEQSERSCNGQMFFHFSNLPKSKGETFNPIYEWEYLDEKGIIQKDSMNFDLSINSQGYITPQQLVESEGGLISNGECGDYDVSDVPIDYADYITYIRGLESDIQEAKSMLASIARPPEAGRTVDPENQQLQDGVTPPVGEDTGGKE